MKTVLINRAVPGSGKTVCGYRCGEVLQNVVRISPHVKPFDYDVLIQITPETYHELKEKIGMQILCLSNADRVSERT